MKAHWQLADDPEMPYSELDITLESPGEWLEIHPKDLQNADSIFVHIPGHTPPLLIMVSINAKRITEKR